MSPCKLNETREESEREKKAFLNNPGSISCKAVFVVENHVKRCWLTRGFKVIAKQKSSFIIIIQVKSSTSLVWPAIDLAGQSRLKINCVEVF